MNYVEWRDDIFGQESGSDPVMVDLPSNVHLLSRSFQICFSKKMAALKGECSRKRISAMRCVASIIKNSPPAVYATNVYKIPPKRGHSNRPNNHCTAGKNHSNNHADSRYTGEYVN